MDLKTYLASLSKSQIVQLKKESGISTGVLSHLRTGVRVPGLKLCARLIRASEKIKADIGVLVLEDLNAELREDVKTVAGSYKEKCSQSADTNQQEQV